MFTSSEPGNLLSEMSVYLKSALASGICLKSIPERLVLKRIVSERFVPARSCSERSTKERFTPVRSASVSMVPVKSAPVSIVPVRFFPFRFVFERSVPAKLILERSIRSTKFELFKFAKVNLAPSIFVFLKLVLLRSALSKTAFCRSKLSKFLPDKSALTAYTTPVTGDKMGFTEYVLSK